MQATANIPAKIAPTNHPIAIRRLVNFYLFYLNKAVHFNYFLIFLASFLSFSIFIWIAAATNARSFRSSPRYSCGHLYFNPRTRVGCDKGHLAEIISIKRISIHAPGWGATVLCNRQTIIIKPFQSTHPHGVRRATSVISSAFGGNFNPRTRVGCDSKAQGQAKSSFEFQSTHPGGVRRSFLRMQRPKNSISIHAPAWGATFNALFPVDKLIISIHAPAWCATFSRIV